MIRFLACALLIVGCGSKGIGAPCARHSDCASGTCGSDGHCAEATEDLPDASTPDASTAIPEYDAGTEPDAEGL